MTLVGLKLSDNWITNARTQVATILKLMKRTQPKPARVAALAKTVRKVDQGLVSEYGFAVLVKLSINRTLMEQKIYSRSGLTIFIRNTLHFYGGEEVNELIYSAL